VLPKVHLRFAPINNCRGVKKRIFSPGVRWQARDRAQHERASAMVFFFPLMKKMWRLILNWRQILTDEKIMGLDGTKGIENAEGGAGVHMNSYSRHFGGG